MSVVKGRLGRKSCGQWHISPDGFHFVMVGRVHRLGNQYAGRIYRFRRCEAGNWMRGVGFGVDN